MRGTRVLIVVALSVLAVIVGFVFRKNLAELRPGQPDLGWVSERWLAEYRADASRPAR